MKVLLLNGPPRSGKDYIGNHLPWAAVKFADPIVNFMLKVFSVDMAQVSKDEPHPALCGRTPREAAIAYSERFCKPLFGIQYFGYEALKKLEWLEKVRQDVSVFTDSGFVHEAEPVAARYKTLQVVISRPGTSFNGDSRSHWESPNIGRILFDNDVHGISKIQTVLLPEIRKWLSS